MERYLLFYGIGSQSGVRQRILRRSPPNSGEPERAARRLEFDNVGEGGRKRKSRKGRKSRKIKQKKRTRHSKKGKRKQKKRTKRSRR